MTRRASEIRPWYGPARGFDFAREVQPVLDQHCVGCHDGRQLEDGRELLDLRDSATPRRDAGLPLSRLGATRLDPSSLTCDLQRFSECGDMPSPYETALHFGDTDRDFQAWANMADRSFTSLYTGSAGVINLQPLPADLRFDDRAIGTAPVGSYQPNARGLYDMHGNLAEWTRSLYRPYPYDATDGRNDLGNSDVTRRRVVRGGSFTDRPLHCRSAFRLAYPDWQPVHNVGFRVVLEADGGATTRVSQPVPVPHPASDTDV